MGLSSMARNKPDDVRPLFDVKAPFYESLNRYTQEVSTLVSALRVILNDRPTDKPLLPDNIAKILRERVEAVERAATGDA
jgi:hypothetical protein